MQFGHATQQLRFAAGPGQAFVQDMLVEIEVVEPSKRPLVIALVVAYSSTRDDTAIAPLPRFMRPLQVIRVAALPRAGVGKVQRAQLNALDELDRIAL